VVLIVPIVNLHTERINNIEPNCEGVKIVRKIKFKVILGRWSVSDVIEVADDTTDKEIEDMYLEWQVDQLDGGWEELD
jgi:L-arabinose isomerase